MKLVADELIFIRALQDVATVNGGAWKGTVCGLLFEMRMEGYAAAVRANDNPAALSRKINALAGWARDWYPRPRSCFHNDGTGCKPDKRCIVCHFGLTITRPKRGIIRIEFEEAAQ